MLPRTPQAEKRSLKCGVSHTTHRRGVEYPQGSYATLCRECGVGSSEATLQRRCVVLELKPAQIVACLVSEVVLAGSDNVSSLCDWQIQHQRVTPRTPDSLVT